MALVLQIVLRSIGRLCRRSRLYYTLGLISSLIWAKFGIELGAKIVLRHAPFGGNPPLPLDPVERRVERALFHAQHILRHLHDALTDAVAVQRPERERLKD